MRGAGLGAALVAAMLGMNRSDRAVPLRLAPDFDPLSMLDTAPPAVAGDSRGNKRSRRRVAWDKRAAAKRRNVLRARGRR